MNTRLIRIGLACPAMLFLFASAVQAQAQLTNASISPASGSSASGAIQTFAATYTDSSGYADIYATDLLVNTTNASVTSACFLEWNSSANGFYLGNDAASMWLGPLTPGSSGMLQNSQCTVYGTGSSVSQSGNQAVMTVRVSFTAAFAGAKYTYMRVFGNGGYSYTTLQQMGSWTISATGYPDLAIVKSHSGNFTQGQSGNYTITVSNSSSTVTSGTVTVSDSLPSGLTASSITGSGWSCTQPGGPCSRSDSLTANGSYPAITFTVAAASNAPASVTNYAYVSGGGETNTSNDTATDVTTINTSGGGSGNLALGKTATQSSTYNDTPSPAASFAVDGNTDGNYYDHSVSTTNNDLNAWWQVDLGSSATVNSVVIWNRTDCCGARLSDYWVFISNTPFLSTDTANSLQNRAATFASHQTTAPSPSTTITIGGYSGRYVRVQLGQGVQNYLSLAEVQVLGSGGTSAPDMTITLNSAASFTQGGTGTYTINASNAGTAATSGTVQVSDTLPTGLTASSITGSGWSCTQPGGPCSRSDSLAVGGSYPAITLTVNVANSATGSLMNTSYVSGGGETNTSNDTATNTVTIVGGGCGTLATMASPTPGTQLPGSAVTFSWSASCTATQYYLYVGSNGVGSNDIIGISANTNLSQPVSGIPTDGRTIYVRLWSLVGTWQSYDYTYAAFNGGGTPVLTIAKSHSGNFTQGQIGTYTITVLNNGSGPTTGLVTVTDTLPAGLTASTMSGSGWNCTPSSATCTNTSALSANGSYPITLTVNVNVPSAPTTVTNSVTVSGGGSGPSNITDSTTINGACLNGAATMATPASGSTLSGSTATFTWNASCTATQYWLYLGTYQGGLDVYSQSQSSNLTSGALSIPSTGILWVRLWSYLSNGWSFFDYSYPIGSGTGSVDPRRVGVRSTGSYWGDAGEQIDLLSGNLNYTLALMQPQARGWSATIALSYNSQIWKWTGTTSSKLGLDVGYGLGWTLQAGSIAPAAPYVFRDATGAEYALDQCVNGVCTSKQGTYVTFDTTTSPPKLHFPDGSFWVMGAISASGEPDAGTWHPTVMEDSNGNQILISYVFGAGAAGGAQYSARIQGISDTRATPGNYTYTFQYNADAIPHLTSITNTIQSAESYTFSPAAQAIQSPFDSSSFGTATLLAGVTLTASNTAYGFQYSTGAGELTQVTTPASGTLGWGYRTFAYSSGISYREVNSRNMASGGITPWSNTWTIGLDSNAAGHASTTVTDSGVNTSKLWNFGTTAGPLLGLVSLYQEQNGSQVATLKKDYTWTPDSAGTPYIGTVKTTLDPGQAYAAQTRSDQVLDIYGNVTSSSTYDYGYPTAPSSPSRTYVSTYLTGLRNRLNGSTVTPAGGQPITLVTNTYDNYTSGITDRPGLTMHDGAFATSNTSRGNLTRSVTPGTARNISYDIGGMAVNASDDYGHSVAITLTGATNYSLPSTIQPNGQTTLQTSTAYNAAFQPTSVADPNNATATQHYASNGRMDYSTSPSGIQTNYTYNDAAHTVTASTGTRTVATTYDGFGRTVRVVVSDNNVVKSTVDTQYGPCACSPLGKMVKVSQPYAPGDTEVWTVYTYDASGRTLTVTAPDGVSITNYSYQGNLTTVTDPLGKWKQYTTDSNGNLVTVTEPNPTGGNLTTTYSYDALNHLTNISMPRASGTQTRTWTYDPSTQRLTQAMAPETGTTQYVYNPDGTLKYKTDQKGQKTQYGYDAFGRMNLIDYYPAGSGQPDLCQEVTLNYDEFNLPAFTTQLWQLGRLTSVHWSQAGTCTYHFQEQYEYTALGQVTLKRLGMASGNSSYVYIDGVMNYDLEGRVANYQTATSTGTPTALGAPDTAYNYSRDGLGRLTGLQYGVTPLVSNVIYGAAGQLQAMTYNDPALGNTGFTETRTYNTNVQLTQITATPTSGMGMSLQYQYGTPGTANNGRVTQVNDLVSGEQVTYQYDSLNRLTQATAATWGQGFQYDGFGNLTGQTGTGTAPSFTGSIDANTNRRTDAGYQYDLNGNVTNMPDGTTYSYDGANRLVSNGAAYDLNNRRVWDGSQIYYYATNGQLLAKYSPQFGGASTIVRTSVNVWFGRKLIRETQPGLQAHQRWVMTDRLGSVRLNGDGDRSNYYPYGQEIQGTSNGRTKFATYYRDTPGLDYADQRYYANAGGRFLTPDPGRSASPQSPGGWNRYAYTRGDPINHYDPSGMDDVNAGCAAFDDAFCDGSALVSNDPMNTGVMAPPGMVNVFCSSLVYDFTAASGVCTISPEQYEDLVDYGPPAPTCPPQYQAYISAYGADATAAKLPEANTLALTSIESKWGEGTFAKGGNSFFNLETFWKPGTPKPGNKFAYQLGWMSATDMILHGPLTGYFAQVATYRSAKDSFLSAAATFSNLTAVDPATFAKNAVADGIYAANSPAFFTREKIFADCLKGQ